MEAKGLRSRQRSMCTCGPATRERPWPATHASFAPADASLAHSRAPRSAGKNIPAMAAAFDVLAFLKQRADYEEASLGDIREGALTQP